MDQSKSLDLNVYEICVDSSLIQSKELIETYLFECQCALLLVDITKEDSFNLIKDLLANINTSKFPYLKMFLVLNKLDDSLNSKVEDKFGNLCNCSKEINSSTCKYEEKKIPKKEGSSMEFLKKKRNSK